MDARVMMVPVDPDTVRKSLDTLLKDSQLTPEDAQLIGDSIKKGMWRRHRRPSMNLKRN